MRFVHWSAARGLPNLTGVRVIRAHPADSTDDIDGTDHERDTTTR
ncbi:MULTISPECIES: hypothetical protein [Nocardiopsis]|uniref:Uncharacterized protein n=1 Tax=Nocardiopsis sinuspersici TaxID=501010 RepID=A0A7Z0BM93_9ACTN|nr:MULTISPECIES: hypothetical protein [Nocardiopsis]NYH55050.1 hypothetical protein [Nocardiopsis sinuspersici]